MDAEYAAKAAEVAGACPGLGYVLIVGDTGPVDFGAGVTTASYGVVAASGRKAFSLESGRSGDDKLLIYTGGTTGLPKGVLWRHEDFYGGVLALIGAEKCMAVAIVGDAMARPIAGELAAHGDSYDLSSWSILGSGGARGPGSGVWRLG